MWYNNRKDSGYYTDSNALFLAVEAATEKEGHYTINQERIYGIMYKGGDAGFMSKYMQYWG
jgi:hypothetical protein